MFTHRELDCPQNAKTVFCMVSGNLDRSTSVTDETRAITGIVRIFAFIPVPNN